MRHLTVIVCYQYLPWLPQKKPLSTYPYSKTWNHCFTELQQSARLNGEGVCVWKFRLNRCFLSDATSPLATVALSFLALSTSSPWPTIYFYSKRTSANFNPYSRGNPFSNCAMILCGPLPPRFTLVEKTNLSDLLQFPSMLDARGPATPAYLAQHAESGHSRYLNKFKVFYTCKQPLTIMIKA